ncbi:MAG: hypothetical protein D6685_10745 [Bacteroidetes bacterium]|nr:hypothetical protein AWN76_011230 [Rhodothermaceae bacterium RA]RMH59880.1 MAG: hypothetical protein D6685_10745 [Bacteroidota bacterium]
MKTQHIIRELEEAARQLGWAVRTERGSFQGGRCIVNGEPLIMLNRYHPPERHLAVLAESLRDLPVDTVYLKPAVRAALEAAWRDRDRAAAGVEAEVEDE